MNYKVCHQQAESGYNYGLKFEAVVSIHWHGSLTSAMIDYFAR